MKKRGLSTVISTLILIGLSLAAVVIIWVVVSNLLTKGSQEISLGKLTTNLEIEKVVSQKGNIDITIKGNPGSGTRTPCRDRATQTRTYDRVARKARPGEARVRTQQAHGGGRKPSPHR